MISIGVSYDSGCMYHLKPSTNVFAKIQIKMKVSNALCSVKMILLSRSQLCSPGSSFFFGFYRIANI